MIEMDDVKQMERMMSYDEMKEVKKKDDDAEMMMMERKEFVDDDEVLKKRKLKLKLMQQLVTAIRSVLY